MLGGTAEIICKNIEYNYFKIARIVDIYIQNYSYIGKFQTLSYDMKKHELEWVTIKDITKNHNDEIYYYQIANEELPLTQKSKLYYMDRRSKKPAGTKTIDKIKNNTYFISLNNYNEPIINILNKIENEKHQIKRTKNNKLNQINTEESYNLKLDNSYQNIFLNEKLILVSLI